MAPAEGQSSGPSAMPSSSQSSLTPSLVDPTSSSDRQGYLAHTPPHRDLTSPPPPTCLQRITKDQGQFVQENFWAEPSWTHHSWVHMGLHTVGGGGRGVSEDNSSQPQLCQSRGNTSIARLSCKLTGVCVGTTLARR